MEQIPLKAQKRTVIGRKVKTLRRDGLIPAHIFGHKIKTEHVQVKATDFSKVFEKAGETGIVDLQVDSAKHPTLIRNVQIHPVTDELLHIDFYQVNLSEKVKVNVPLEIVEEAPAVAKKIGLLLTPVSEIEIEALPTDIPENIQVNVSKLENIGDEIRIKDLSIDRSKIEVKADEELVVASIGELLTKEMEAVEAELEAETAATVAAAEAPAEPGAVEAAAAQQQEKPESGEGAVKDQSAPKEETPKEEK